MAKKKRWIKEAIGKPGALRRQAKAAGMGTMEFARARKGAKGTTGRRARLAITLRGPKVAGEKRKAARKRGVAAKGK